jgi:hypothetical protein
MIAKLPAQQHRRAHPLRHASRDEHGDGRRQPARQRADSKPDEPAHHDPLVAVQIADRPAGKHQRSE